MTDKLYLKDMYLKETSAKIIGIDGNALELDRTIFAPDAGGQVCDLGTIDLKNVENVIQEDDRIFHMLEDTSSFKEGDVVNLVIDWRRRFDHMQNHCGEHIVSGLFKREYDADNKGFHLGDDVVTLDIDLKEISSEMLSNIELLANNCIYDNTPVLIDFVEDRDKAGKFPLRKEVKAEKNISVVTIDGVDCVACCCPHPHFTSEIGIIKIVKTEKYKGMTRVFIKCGWRALEDYRVKHEIVKTLNKKYSAEDNTLIEKIDIQDKKNQSIRTQYFSLKKKLAVIDAAELAKNAAENELKIIKKEYESGTIDDLMTIGKQISGLSDLPIVLSSLNSTSVLLIHSGVSKLDFGSLVKEFASGSGGKGGGNNSMARAVFKDPELMRNFVEIVCAHVR